MESVGNLEHPALCNPNSVHLGRQPRCTDVLHCPY